MELCSTLKELFGWDVQRSVQYSGKAGDSDLLVKNLPGLFVECKRVENLNLPAAMEVAAEQAGPKLPAVFHRRDRHPWLLTIQLSDLMEFCQMVSQSSAIRLAPSDRTCRPDTT